MDEPPTFSPPDREHAQTLLRLRLVDINKRQLRCSDGPLVEIQMPQLQSQGAAALEARANTRAVWSCWTQPVFTAAERSNAVRPTSRLSPGLRFEGQHHIHTCGRTETETEERDGLRRSTSLARTVSRAQRCRHAIHPSH